MAFISHNLYDMPWLVPLMNVLWEQQTSFSGLDMSGDVLLGSYMVDIGFSSNNMKYFSRRNFMIFWGMTISSDSIHWYDISLSRDIITKLDLITDFDRSRFPEVFMEHLQRLRLANSGRLLLRTPGPVPLGNCICSYIETSPSWTCHVSGLWVTNICWYFCFASMHFEFKAMRRWILLFMN